MSVLQNKDQIIYIRENGTRGVKTAPSEEPSLTQQQFKDDCDVNVIMKKLLRGEQPHLNLAKQGLYMDLVGQPDYYEAMQTIATADSAFAQLPAEIRSKFENDPAKMISYLADQKNDEEAIELGLKIRNNRAQQNLTQSQAPEQQSPTQSQQTTETKAP